MVDQWTRFIVAMCWKNLRHSIVVTLNSAVSYIWMCTSGLAACSLVCPLRHSLSTMVFSHVKTTLTQLLSPSPNKVRRLTDQCALVETFRIKSSWLPLPELQSSGSLWPLPPVVFCLSLQGSQLGTPWVNRAAGPPRSSHQLNRIQRKACVLLQATPGLQDFQTCLGWPQDYHDSSA